MKYGYDINASSAGIYKKGSEAEEKLKLGFGNCGDDPGLVVGTSEWIWMSEDNARRICAALTYFDGVKTEEMERLAEEMEEEMEEEREEEIEKEERQKEKDKGKRGSCPFCAHDCIIAFYDNTKPVVPGEYKEFKCLRCSEYFKIPVTPAGVGENV